MKRLRRGNGSTVPDGRHFPPPTALEVIRHITRPHALDPEVADRLPRVRVPPLSDDIAVVTDQIVLRSPEYWKRLMFSWYRSPKPKEVIAAELEVFVCRWFTTSAAWSWPICSDD